MTKQTRATLYWVGFVVAVIAAIAAVATIASSQPGELDAFATCLGQKGTTFYGAFWCPHCQDQKLLFGRSVKKLPYVECSTPDGQGQTQICKDKGITGYPTWVFADGSRESRVLTPEELSAKTSCPLPSSSGAPVPTAPVDTGTSSARV